MVLPSPTDEPVYSQNLPRTPEAAHHARRLVRSVLRRWGLDDLEEEAELVAVELMSNAARHARFDSVRLTVTRSGEHRVSVAVTDRSRVMPHLAAAGDDDEGGRGLAIVDALSSGRWGADPLGWGKRVWAELGDRGEQ
ncbi:ATP-binding protein [Streptomyces sp. NPDC048416]|uniref:ATP-binding protein n=1 Tax=Streptomyces sp. NPDC048416 TaxID=3365546 RepID=UPI0037229B2A